MLNRIENMVNRYFDRDWVWWPFLRVRPMRHESFSWKRVCLLIAIDAVMAVGPFIAIVLILQNINPWLFIIIMFMLSALGERPQVTLTLLMVIMIVVMRVLMATAWNRRARRLVAEGYDNG